MGCRILIAFVAFSMLASLAQPWCVECAWDCSHTVFAPQYDWWFCSCPTWAGCMQVPESCENYYHGTMVWCDDVINNCRTYYLGGYDWFCGCGRYRYAGRPGVPVGGSRCESIRR